MKSINGQIPLYFMTIFFVLVLTTAFHAAAFADSPELSKAVFYVTWYDVGQSALDGLQGVKKIEKGFRNLREINTVYYDPAMITIEAMESALKRAGTYRDTLK